MNINTNVERSQNYLSTYIPTLDTYVDPIEFNCVMKALTEFFHNEGYTEVPTQNRFSILSACEDPKTIVAIDYCGNTWPLPQTGQMWLEYEILTRSDLKGVFCKTTSYREEKNPVPGRHFVSFPLFEFETRGNFEDLLQLLTKLIKFLGYQDPVHLDYNSVATSYDVTEIKHEHETRIGIEHGNACFLKNFPVAETFWNMKRNEDGITAKKCDVLLSGAETIGCAERSTDVESMKETFYNTSGGDYHKLIFEKFGEERTRAELEAFLALTMVPRFGAGLGVTRLISSLKKEGLMNALLTRFG
jgi:aspartyl/asparaginyl-tRNA synthetase